MIHWSLFSSTPCNNITLILLIKESEIVLLTLVCGRDHNWQERCLPAERVPIFPDLRTKACRLVAIQAKSLLEQSSNHLSSNCNLIYRYIITPQTDQSKQQQPGQVMSGLGFACKWSKQRSIAQYYYYFFFLPTKEQRDETQKQRYRLSVKQTARGIGRSSVGPQ